MKKIVSQILGISQASYYRWKKERMGINLIEKYFTKEDLEEYIHTGKVERLERTVGGTDDMEEFFLKSALGKIELYGTRWDTDLYVSRNITLGEEIEALLPTKVFLVILTSRVVSDIRSFHELLYEKKKITRIEKLIIKDFIDNKLSKLELSALLKNKKYVAEYLDSLPNLNGTLKA